MRGNRIRYGVRFLALGYLAALLIAAARADLQGRVQGRAWGRSGTALTDVDTVHAAKLTLYAMLIAVVAQHHLRHRDGALPLAAQGPAADASLGAFIDLPLALSPVVVGLALVLVFSSTGWFGPWLTEHGFPGHVRVPLDRDRDRRSSACRSSRAS